MQPNGKNMQRWWPLKIFFAMMFGPYPICIITALFIAATPTEFVSFLLVSIIINYVFVFTYGLFAFFLLEAFKIHSILAYLLCGIFPFLLIISVAGLENLVAWQFMAIYGVGTSLGTWFLGIRKNDDLPSSRIKRAKQAAQQTEKG